MRSRTRHSKKTKDKSVLRILDLLQENIPETEYPDEEIPADVAGKPAPNAPLLDDEEDEFVVGQMPNQVTAGN